MSFVSVKIYGDRKKCDELSYDYSYFHERIQLIPDSEVVINISRIRLIIKHNTNRLIFYPIEEDSHFSLKYYKDFTTSQERDDFLEKLLIQ